MECIYCNYNTHVVYTRQDEPTNTRRRRECLKCKMRFTTIEIVLHKNMIGVKNEKGNTCE